MSGQVSEEELQRALRTIMAAGREDLLTGQGLRESAEGVRRPQRVAAAGVAAAILACESPSSGSEGGRLSDALKGKKGGAGGSKGKGPAKKQRREKEVEDVQERTNRVLEALREEERRQKEGLVDQESGEEGDEELEEGEYAEEEGGLGYGLEESEEEVPVGEGAMLAGEGAMQSAVGGDQVVSRPNPPVFVVPQPAKERPVVADTVAAVTSGVERPLEDRQAGAGGYKTGELKEEVLKVWGEVLKKKEQQWEDKFEQQWAAHEKERKTMKMVNDEYCAKQQRERAFMRNKSEELCNAMQGRLDQVEELCAGLKRNNDMLERKLWEEQSGGGER